MNLSHTYCLATLVGGFLLFAPARAVGQEPDPKVVSRQTLGQLLDEPIKNASLIVLAKVDRRKTFSYGAAAGVMQFCYLTVKGVLKGKESAKTIGFALQLTKRQGRAPLTFSDPAKQPGDVLVLLKDRRIAEGDVWYIPVTKLPASWYPADSKAAKYIMKKIASGPPSSEWTFEDAAAGKLPPGWSSAKTGKGPGSVWKVLLDKTAPKGSKVLAQTSSKGPRPLFNLCVAKKSNFKDLDLTVSFKAVKGRIDQGGGPMWRYQDNNNYYIARMNPLEENFRVYKVVDGARKQLATADVTAPAGKWHTMRIVHKDNRIQGYLNGKLHLDVKDDTFRKAGKVGLWTKADAVTNFDALRVVAISGSKK